MCDIGKVDESLHSKEDNKKDVIITNNASIDSTSPSINMNKSVVSSIYSYNSNKEKKKNMRKCIKGLHHTIKNKLNLYVKLMLDKYIQESSNYIKNENKDIKKTIESKNKDDKICLLCNFSNYIYKGRLIPFYDIYIHSECLKWSLNCTQCCYEENKNKTIVNNDNGTKVDVNLDNADDIDRKSVV